jgi:hypothetical protein
MPTHRALNGGVYRGPDLQPRGVVRAIYLKTLSDGGELALPPAPKRSGAAKRKRTRAKHAAVHNVARAQQGIALDAAEGDVEARSHVLRLLRDMHEALQPGKDEQKNGHGGGPVRTKFTREPGPPRTAPRTEAAAEPAVIVDGQPYVEAD